MAKSSRTKSGFRFRRFFFWTLGIGATLAIVALIALGIAVYTTKASLPSYQALKSSPNGQMIRVHAADGTVMMSLGPSYGEWIAYDDIPPVMRKAMVSIEDKRFYSHIGVDPIGALRAAKFAIDHRGTGRRMQGASTITQQVARTIFLSNRYTLGRKLREAILALALERKFTKDQILELYLNKVYFGGGAYGIDAASRRFFGHSATNLSLGEAAIIAGLVKAPSHYSPTADAEAAVGRAGVVLDVMVENGAITPGEAASADPEDIKLAQEPNQNSVRYFTDWALPQLEMLIDETQAPLEVWTTLDLSMQKAAEKAVRAEAPKGVQGALVALDRDGAVRALVGGKDYVSSNYNRATQAVRQPGSAWKLFVYLAAMEAGYKPDDMVIDEPVDIRGWSPRNSNGRFAGNISIRTAFAYSINTIAAKLGQDVGFNTVADMARRFGISTDIDTHPAMVLGTSEVHLIDMTQAFASVANRGVAVDPFGITRVTANGRVIYQHEVDTSRVLVAPYIAAEMTDLLQTAVNTGTGRSAQIGRPVAGKTGTTQSNKDGWFLGFSSGLTTGVWMGKDDADPVSGLYGGTAPARAFADFMRKAVADRPVEQFDTKVTLPDWQVEPDEESYYSGPDNGLFEDGDVPPEPEPRFPGDGYGPQPVPGEAFPQQPTQPPQPVPQQRQQPPERLDERWIDRVLGRDQPAGNGPTQQPRPSDPNQVQRLPRRTPTPQRDGSATQRQPAPSDTDLPNQ
ncbi:PBP1A family penicillin-binding protein [Stakelama sp. CBK3Z-3]|uniref:PBP1A family penicillin-binding protein n=1 Tax=Stakelama flava TaxID=2860338 RepID=A0ABS6XKK5_9SPHN|nr:PBP1A family penicillin-binding protein [Stakelama flava]MBW4330740.1 PBP1A family penicillin-binding protein [Stakelama flava]